MMKRRCISGVRSVFPHLLDTKVYNKCYIYNKCYTKKSNKVQYSLNNTTISRYYAGLFYKIANQNIKI